MTVLFLVLAGTALAIVLLVLYSSYLFEENRTRVERGRRSERTGLSSADPAPAGDTIWRTLVDPVEAANRARASQPFAAAYARGMTMVREDNQAA